MTAPLDAATENLLRELVPRVLSIVARRFGDFSDAEDATQEALVAATMRWPDQGIPANPRAWLIHVASKRMLDYARSESARRRREAVVFSSTPASGDFDELRATEEDDSLALLFMCAHPELPRSSAIALTLRAVGGLTTAEIASAYLVPEATMAQRITRAKARIKASGVSFSMPADIERSDRLAAVLHIVYLIFNEGYVSTVGPALQRRDLSNEAIRLARMLHRLLPRDTEVAGLLALMLLTDARRLARTNAYGEIIPLAQQDRTLWDREQIAEGSALIQGVFGKAEIGPYQLQAAIAALHDDAGDAADTDWAEILQLYTALQRIWDNPMVRLNRAVAVAMVDGPQHALDLLEELRADKRICEHHRFEAVRAHLFEMSGNYAMAVASYVTAARQTKSIPERDYLQGRAAHCKRVAVT
jgi:RNA polymerase sigma factor (sigma-70 family)